jgi:hypothetical protein
MSLYLVIREISGNLAKNLKLCLESGLNGGLTRGDERVRARLKNAAERDRSRVAADGMARTIRLEGIGAAEGLGAPSS